MFRPTYLFSIFICLWLCASNISKAAETPLYIYKDTAKNTTIASVLENAVFQKHPTDILNLGLGYKSYWIRTTPNNELLKQNDLTLFIDQSRLLFVEVFYVKKKTVLAKQLYRNHNLVSTKSQPGNVRYFEVPKDLLHLKPDIYIHIISNELFVVPIRLQKAEITRSTLFNRDLVFGLYSGALLIMFLYNLFLYFSVRDRNYVFYVFYIFFTWLTQISVQGYTSKYLWPENTWLHQHCVTIFSVIALLFGLIFTMSFLNTAVLAKKIHHLLLKTLFGLAIISLIVSFSPYAQTSFVLMQFLTLTSCIVALWAAYYIYFKKKFKPAGYYLLAWTVLVIGIVFFILKDYEIIPFNNFTVYILQIASVIEVSLLSFALADKINFFKQENEIAQKNALEISKENERLIREQNIELERKVHQRTDELQQANNTLNQAIKDLKDAQSQLVDSEKMAGLGQLTAGIAHEINNPINFVTSNIKPLELDIKDLNDVIDMYDKIDHSSDLTEQLAAIESFKKRIDLTFIKEEINSLLNGIKEGASRTSEIIRSLKNFSRLDESDTKPVDLNEGLDSTLILVRSTFPSNLQVNKNYSELPKVECLPGKMNQVFMNLISNAVEAIKSNDNPHAEERLDITTWREQDMVKVSIKDSGSGMSEEVKNKIFEPFFTTKDVGEGTGLGLSIVYRIIESHNGSIEVFSKINEGTEFIITLPINR